MTINDFGVTDNKLILYADDDIDDRTWFEDACKAVCQSWKVHFVETGRQVIDYLENKPVALPTLIMLDLNMPGMDGRQTLKKLKETEIFQSIPIVMVTNSINRMDKEVCQRLGADLLITKPNTMSQWQQVIRELAASYLV